MRYAVIDVKDGDMFDTNYKTKEEALKAADKAWAYLTEKEKKNREAFYVVECEKDDEEAPDYYDGNIVKDYKNEF